MRIKATFINASPHLPSQNIKDFLIANEQVTFTLAKAEQLHGHAILHISASQLREDPSTKQKYIGGGGLAETLRSQIPLEASCGLRSSLYLPKARESFYQVTQHIFSLLVGSTDQPLSKEEHNEYLQTCAAISSIFRAALGQENPSIVVFHDFEFLPLVNSIPKSMVKVLHWHVDFPGYQDDRISSIVPYLNQFDAAIAADQTTAQRLSRLISKTKVIAPAINPYARKLERSSQQEVERILTHLSIDPHRPIILQVGRFSAQKDPVSAAEVYKLVKAQIPAVQLVLAGMFNIAGSDFDVTQGKLQEQAMGDSDMHYFATLEEISPFTNDEFLSALYTASNVLINMGKNEGFGLAMTEAMWHRKIVIAMDSPGARTQINSGHSGYIVSDLNEAVDIVCRTLDQPGEFWTTGEQARKSVSSNYLITRYMRDVIDTYHKLLHSVRL